ncbi:longevity assurance proteins LAG1 LAC1 [Epithele typhae]|uniref:longevity assurance proteins LAG1 LAC1 n=1 Tax=Epithele typhae TaxID=378194 RepID=UPI0020086E5E|nr:longevity assurance proteins LAG1 LAC1 [Epithele typhae]KAH9943466.1 longevity assurance proteins LAG1 LAC1 [Epithele typhae]
MSRPVKRRPQAINALEEIEDDPSHHITGPFRPQTPLGQESASPSPAPTPSHKDPDKRLLMAVVPVTSLKILLVVVLCWVNWELLTPYLGHTVSNPFTPLIFVSYRVPSSTDDDHDTKKDVVVFKIFRPFARSFGIKKTAKLDRFGEQGYAMVYFGIMAAWGIRIMGQLPTWWYYTENFWIDYPHWEMKPELKRYYLMQTANWLHQTIILALGLEKPRKDVYELIAHHIVTLWLVCWSYLVNMTFMGSAVFLSMDLPDSAFAFSKLLNYLQMERAKAVSFVIFFGIWSYFRHWLNWTMLYSIWFEFDLIPEASKQWLPESGAWMAPWMRYQMFLPLLLLQGLCLFWYVLICRVAVRAVSGPAEGFTDDRSDDEGDGEGDE